MDFATKKGQPPSQDSGWRDRSFCTTRKGLLLCISEHSGEVDRAAPANLAALPLGRSMQNLDAHGGTRRPSSNKTQARRPLSSSNPRRATDAGPSATSGRSGVAPFLWQL